MDGTIKIWSPGSSAVEVINPTPEFKYPEEDPPAAGGGRGYRQQMQVGTLWRQALAAVTGRQTCTRPLNELHNE